VTPPYKRKIFLIENFVTRGRWRQGRIQGGDFGIKTPPLIEIFFNLLGFFEKKIQNNPPNFAVHTKNSKHHP